MVERIVGHIESIRERKKMQSKIMAFGQKAVCTVASVALAASVCVVAPAAGNVQQAYADSADATGYVTCASYRAAEPAPEILGLSNVATNTAWASVGELTWGAPYYYIMGTSEYNTNPNPYMVNAVYNANYGSGAAPSMIYDGTRKGGPMASLGDYTTSQVVWDMLPDVILGNNQGVNYNSENYSQAAAAANGVEDYAVTPDKGVVYDSSNIYTMIDVMYNLAAAGDTAVANSNGTKKLRYGSAELIAEEYETFVKGMQGYVLEQLATDKAEKKTVALINNYDETTGAYTLVASGVAEGTATANRYLEALQFVATNLGNSQETCTSADLDNVDLILVGSQAGSETLSSTETLVGSLTADQVAKCFWVDSSNGSAGSCYGVVMNSVENAQNFARILPCLYPEYLDQSDMVAYYYQNFYHLNTGKLAECMANAMDGVRNWNATATLAAGTTWEISDVDGYVESDVQAILDEGMSYINANSESVPSYLLPTSHLAAGDSTELAEEVAAAEVVYNALDTRDYTEDSLAAFQAAIKAAGEVAGNESATQGMIDQAQLDMNEAYNNLEKVYALTVNLKYGDETDTAKSYTASELDELAEASTADPISSAYCKSNNWRVYTTDNYVTLADLFADAEIGQYYIEGSSVDVGNSKAGAKTYEYLNNAYYASQATNESAAGTADVKVEPCIALTSYVTYLTDDESLITVADGVARNEAGEGQVASETMLSLYGWSEEILAAGQTAGNQFWRDVTEVTLCYTPAAEVTTTATSVGSTATFTCNTNLIDPTYQWQYTKNGTKWINPSASTTDELAYKATASNKDYQFRCVVTGSDGTEITTDAVAFNIVDIDIATWQAGLGTYATFTVSGEGLEGATYQWQYSKNGAKWLNTTVSTTETLEYKLTASNQDYSFRCAITLADGSLVYSDATGFDQIAVTASTEGAALGEKATFTVDASAVTATDVTYQWQYSKNGGKKWINSSAAAASTDTFTAKHTATTDAYQYRCMVVANDGATTVYSDAMTF